jgi:hypothetical protein
MNTFFMEVRQTLVPRGEVKHGPLPPLLLKLIDLLVNLRLL